MSPRNKSVNHNIFQNQQDLLCKKIFIPNHLYQAQTLRSLKICGLTNDINSPPSSGLDESVK